MNGYIAFVKKEFMENIRTFKFLILFAVFFIFGMTSPLMAKLMPELMKSVDMQGIQLTIQDPVATDSYMQFFKNNGQMGLLILVFVFGSLLTREYTKGTLINVLTKGLSRKAVIAAKFTVASISWTVSIGISFLTTYGYTVYLFPGENVDNLIQSVGALWIFGIFLIALILFASAIVNNTTSCLLLIAIIIGVLFTINIIPAVKPYNPVLLASDNYEMVRQGCNYEFSNIIKSLLVTLLLIVGLIGTSMALFDKKKL